MKGLASLWEAWLPCETLSLPDRSPAFFWEARPPCDRRSLPVRCPASLREARLSVRGLGSLWSDWPPCERPGLPVRGPVSLWDAWPPCERPTLPVARPPFERFCLLMGDSSSLWEAQSPCERPSLPVRGLENQIINYIMPFGWKNCLLCFFFVAKKYLRIWSMPDLKVWKSAFWGCPANYDSLLVADPFSCDSTTNSN